MSLQEQARSLDMSKTISKPIDLIVANAMHDAVASLHAADPLIEALMAEAKRRNIELPPAPKPSLNADNMARDLLCKIAHDADISKVFAALKAVGAPDTADMIREGVQAVKDRQ